MREVLSSKFLSFRDTRARREYTIKNIYSMSNIDMHSQDSSNESRSVDCTLLCTPGWGTSHIDDEIIM